MKTAKTKKSSKFKVQSSNRIRRRRIDGARADVVFAHHSPPGVVGDFVIPAGTLKAGDIVQIGKSPPPRPPSLVDLVMALDRFDPVDRVGLMEGRSTHRAEMVKEPRGDYIKRSEALALLAPLSTGVSLIAHERARQVTEEGWSSEHDDEHDSDELARAAALYAMPGRYRALRRAGLAPSWLAGWFKSTPDDRVRELVKAGALVAAEIERLMRAGRAGPRSYAP